MGGCGSDNDVRGIAGGCGVVGVCLDVVSFADSGSRSTSNCLSGGYSGISASCREVESIPMLTTGYSLASAADAMYAEIVVCRLVLASVQATLLGCDVVPPCLRCCACAVILSTGGGGGKGMPVIAACLQESVLWREGDWLRRASACSQELATFSPLFSFVSYQFVVSCRIVSV